MNTGKVFVVTAISTAKKSEGERHFVGDKATWPNPLRARLFSEQNRIQLLRFMDKAKENARQLSINPHTLLVQSLDWSIGNVEIGDDPDWYEAVNVTAMAKLNPVEIEGLRLTGRAVQHRIAERSDAIDIPADEDIRVVELTEGGDESDANEIARLNREPVIDAKSGQTVRIMKRRGINSDSLVRWARREGYEGWVKPAKGGSYTFDDRLFQAFAAWAPDGRTKTPGQQVAILADLRRRMMTPIKD